MKKLAITLVFLPTLAFADIQDYCEKNYSPPLDKKCVEKNEEGMEALVEFYLHHGISTKNVREELLSGNEAAWKVGRCLKEWKEDSLRKYNYPKLKECLK